MPTITVNKAQHMQELLKVRQQNEALAQEHGQQIRERRKGPKNTEILSTIKAQLDDDLMARRDELADVFHDAQRQLADAKVRYGNHLGLSVDDKGQVKAWATKKSQLESELAGYENLLQGAVKAFREAQSALFQNAKSILDDLAREHRKTFEDEKSNRTEQLMLMLRASDEFEDESQEVLKKLQVSRLRYERFNLQEADL